MLLKDIGFLVVLPTHIVEVGRNHLVRHQIGALGHSSHIVIQITVFTSPSGNKLPIEYFILYLSKQKKNLVCLLRITITVVEESLVGQIYLVRTTNSTFPKTTDAILETMQLTCIAMHWHMAIGNVVRHHEEAHSQMISRGRNGIALFLTELDLEVVVDGVIHRIAAVAQVALHQ